MNAEEVKRGLAVLGDKKYAVASQRFFKTGKGEYGEGDVFLGIKVPVQRTVARRYAGLSHKDIHLLLKSSIHEHRLVALVIMIEQYKYSDIKGREKIFRLYLKNYKNINNWDLVDISAPHIIGGHLLNKPKKVLYDFAQSKNLWKKRIAIISTLAFIRNNKFDDTFRLAEILLEDTHDLIHKATGWMLREIGKKNQTEEEKFLKKHYKKMARTALRYAIERFPEKLRRAYLEGTI